MEVRVTFLVRENLVRVLGLEGVMLSVMLVEQLSELLLLPERLAVSSLVRVVEALSLPLGFVCVSPKVFVGRPNLVAESVTDNVLLMKLDWLELSVRVLSIDIEGSTVKELLSLCDPESVTSSLRESVLVELSLRLRVTSSLCERVAVTVPVALSDCTNVDESARLLVRAESAAVIDVVSLALVVRVHVSRRDVMRVYVKLRDPVLVASSLGESDAVKVQRRDIVVVSDAEDVSERVEVRLPPLIVYSSLWDTLSVCVASTVLDGVVVTVSEMLRESVKDVVADRLAVISSVVESVADAVDEVDHETVVVVEALHDDDCDAPVAVPSRLGEAVTVSVSATTYDAECVDKVAEEERVCGSNFVRVNDGVCVGGGDAVGTCVRVRVLVRSDDPLASVRLTETVPESVPFDTLTMALFVEVPSSERDCVRD